MVCGDCENIDATLNLIKDKADEKVTWENKEAVMYTVEESILAVRKWKAHIIRSRNQEEARSSIVEDMTHTDVVITSDWAMKFLPRKYQEGPCDRRASHVKSIVRRYINEGHDVTTALQMREAIDREKKKDIKVNVVSSVNIVDVVSSKSNIPSISLMYNFHFTESGLRMWKAFSIGEGKLLKWNQLGTPSKTAELKTITNWIGGDIIRTREDENGNKEHCTTKEARITVFKCPEDSCTREFSTSAAVDDHVRIGYSINSSLYLRDYYMLLFYLRITCIINLYLRDD
ncbi:unnamed protein product [Mytilus coruscus]|uniref:C2H2-type domain-containing protein n=1 Tax=Mytilus coruscus TaxID=42192 RepID=A0A6J8D7L5_MYTCO|nr:unnamed protein product [Mytilus coruscus]